MTTQEMPFGGSKMKAICDELDSVNFDWRAILLEAHNNRSQSIARAKEAQNNRYLTTDCPKTFAAEVCFGIARIEVRNRDFAKKLMGCTGGEDVAKVFALETLDAMSLEVALEDYHVRFAWNNNAVFAVHRRAPAWVEKFTVLNADQLDAACCLGIDRFNLEGIENLVIDEADCLNPATFFSKDKAAANAAGIYARAHKYYVFARTAGGGVALKRSLLDTPNPPLGVREASYPDETSRLMTDCTPFIITDDATWGQILLGKIAPAAGSRTESFLAQFREVYKIEPAENVGGVVCSRR
jgi:ribosomal protein S27E